MINQIVVRKIDVTEVEKLKEVGILTFTESFAHLNTESDMKQYLDKSFNNAQILSELENPESDFYFAEINGEVVGYLKLNYGKAQTEQKLQNSLEIERIYILAKFQGNRIGQLFFDKALEVANARKAEYLWLGVWEHNEGALRFYKRNGLEPFDKHVFWLGEDKQYDILMKMPLKAEQIS
ncbi:GNAT family N-acetyltransferase [Chondrinema litorale]|uniref:GNAT family N-acetyltransferase n=1 Tax=Chondrinema litorale TaxID=2994555 RepID=UPI00254350E3|nr:GNAT family N-acetyltransferase [Chondrinema litorale]UZR97641.1 GNAT family N-acetyltransferase [Chondrinema litorale]